MKKQLMAAIFVLFVSIIVLRITYRFFEQDQCCNFYHDDDCVDMITQRMGDEVTGSLQKEEITYNFGHMINLIDNSKNMSSHVAKMQHGFFSRLKSAPYDEVQNLLTQLVRERVRLRTHIWDLKGYSRVGIPVRRYRAFLYYLEVLDDCIVDMQTILKRRSTKMHELSSFF